MLLTVRTIEFLMIIDIFNNRTDAKKWDNQISKNYNLCAFVVNDIHDVLDFLKKSG